MTTTSPTITAKQQRSFINRPAVRLTLILLMGALLITIVYNDLNDLVVARSQTFSTIFLSIFIEAVPFLLAGSIVSGFIEIFVDKSFLYRFTPRNPIVASVCGGGMGLIFPVCECGVVPVTRRLYQKGLPMSMGIAFLLSAPVVNPVVMASTYAAFGWGPMLWARIGLTFLIAAAIGFMFSIAKPEEVLLPDPPAHDHDHHHHADTFGAKVWESLATAGDDFLDMARYLIAGSMMAAAMQTVVPQPLLLQLGSGALTSVVAMMTLAFVLSVCSTVDAFLALAFVNSFTPASILAFLVFGPMVDIKSALMFLGVFRKRIVFYLIVLPLMFSLSVAVYLNLNVAW